MSNDINLLPGKTKHASPLLKRRQLLHGIALGLLFVIAFFSVTLFSLISLSPLPSLRQKEKDATQRISTFNDTIIKLNLTRERIAQIKQVLGKRAIYAKSIETVRQILPSNTAIKEISLEQNKNNIVITVESKSLSAMGEFISSIVDLNATKKIFKKITVTSFRQDFSSNMYLMTFSL